MKNRNVIKEYSLLISLACQNIGELFFKYSGIKSNFILYIIIQYFCILYLQTYILTCLFLRISQNRDNELFVNKNI